MVHLREHAHRLLHRAHDVVHVGLEQEHRAVVVGLLGELRDHLAAGLEPFLGLCSWVAHPLGFSVVGAGLRDDVGRAESAGVADDLLQPIHIGLTMAQVRVDDIGVAGDAGDRQVLGPEGVANGLGLVLGDLPGAEIDVLEVQVELHGVEAVAADPLGGLGEAVGEVAGENARLHHGGCPSWILVDLDLGQLDGAPLVDGPVTGLHELHGPDIVGDRQCRGRPALHGVL